VKIAPIARLNRSKRGSPGVAPGLLEVSRQNPLTPR
jgi:hypothetical protein